MAAAAFATAIRHEPSERVLLWLLVGGLGWAPFWYGSNDLIAWGINAMIFPGLAVAYEVSLLVRGKPHPVAVAHLALPAMLFAAAVLWIAFQMIRWGGTVLPHPIWQMAAENLGTPLAGSITPDRDLTTLALIRLITAAAAFWLSLQLCRDGARAEALIKSLVVIVCGYAVYGLVALAFASGRLPGFEAPRPDGLLSSTFVNRNSYATYAGIGLLATVGLAAEAYRQGVFGGARLQIANLVETIGRGGALLPACGFLITASLLLTGSRGGIIATGCGLLALVGLSRGQREKRDWRRLPIALIAGSMAGLAILSVFGGAFVNVLAARGLIDADRLRIDLLALRSILDRPILGHGYGTFVDIFPMYRDRSIEVAGAWAQAHNTYLEIFQGLGVVFGSLLVLSVVLLVLQCLRGARNRRRDTVAPRLAIGAAVLVGVHALVDFSLQIQAVALIFAAVLGAGVAQSASSRAALQD